MFCTKCHYGSQSCRFPSAGDVAVGVVEEDGNGRLQITMRPVAMFRCPMCGTVDKHLAQAPYKVKLPGDPRTMKKQKVDRAARAEEVSSDIRHITGGDVKAFDYQKLQ